MAFLRGGGELYPLLSLSNLSKALCYYWYLMNFLGTGESLLNFVLDLDLQDFIFVEWHGFVRSEDHRRLEFMLNVSHRFHFNKYLIDRYVNQC